MAPGNKERHPGHTGTIPKTKVRNNCNVPQEAVTPTRRDMATNMVTTSLDWVPVSEYNTRSNCNQSRKQTNNTSDQELTDLDNSVSYEGGFGRFVPVRPQPRALPLTVQNREGLSVDQHDDAASTGSNTLHPYAHQMQNGLIPHSNHAAAAVMIVNPTTPNAVAGNINQQLNNPNQNRNNLTRNLNSTRNTFEGHNAINNNTPPVVQTRSGTKSVNLMNNMYDQGQGGFHNVNENHSHRESARALGEAIVAACPDAAAVERRLGQIREYIRVTSSLVDTMRNSEDETFIEHTKEEYDELVKMVMQLRESETKLESLLVNNGAEVSELRSEEINSKDQNESIPQKPDLNLNKDKSNIKPVNDNHTNSVKKVTNIENEHLNRTIINAITNEVQEDTVQENGGEASDGGVEIREIKSVTCEPEVRKDDQQLNYMLRKNILSCVEKIAVMEEMKNKKDSINREEQQDVVVRPASLQSNGSVYSDSELWQSEIKNKMELSQIRLSALKQQQKRLLKYQAEAKQQLEELNKERQAQEIHHPSTSHDNFVGMQNMTINANYHPQNRMYAPNPVGVATTLPQAELEAERAHDAFLLRDAPAGGSEEALSEEEGAEGRGRVLRAQLRDLRAKKVHMENLVSEFQKLQMVTRLGSSRNTYSSSGDDSGEDEPSRNKTEVNLKNEDPFKLMEIKAIKTALQKTKDLMRSVETFEADHLSGVQEESFHMPGHSNIHDNKSEGGGSMGGWSNDSVCRVRNALSRHKFTNEQQQQQQQQHQHQQQQFVQQQMQHMQPQQIQQQSHEANINSLQELAQELRMETEKIMGERARIKDMVTNKERKQKKINEEAVRGAAAAAGVGAAAAAAGPAERRQMQLRAMLADKQRELEALLNKKVMGSDPGAQVILKAVSRDASIVNGSYNSEPEEAESRSEHVEMDSHMSRDNGNYSGGEASRAASVYADTDIASRTKMNQRNRSRRRPAQDRQADDNNVPIQNNANANIRHDSRSESTVNMAPPVAQNIENTANTQYPHLPPTCWNTMKSNQDMRTNQFPQSHPTSERAPGTSAFAPAAPFNMMMPFGVVGACGCVCGAWGGCGVWGAWGWQQLAAHAREIHALREQVAHLEERWRAETASHTLNNQVPPGNRANNYWDNFRSYSRQNLLSTNKSNAEGHVTHALGERAHNSLQHTSSSTSPSLTPKRNTAVPPSAPPGPAPPGPPPPTAYERSLSFSSAPDVLNVNQNPDDDASHLNVNRPDPPAQRNLYANPIPEILQSHSNNLNAPANKRKSSAKLPAKNAANRRNCDLAFSATSNIDIASSSSVDAPNPNLASGSREMHDKATSKLFDLLRENIYSEVTTLIGVNESHPDFLIQLFRELQSISSDPLRQRVLQSIRGVLAQYGPIMENDNDEAHHEELATEVTTTSSEPPSACQDCNAQNACSSSVQIDNKIVRFLLLKSEEMFTTDLLESLSSLIITPPADGRRTKRLLDLLSKYEGMRICDVSGDIIENMALFTSVNNEGDESNHLTGEISESSILQDVAGSLNLFSSSESQLHQLNACPYDMWPGHVHMDINGGDMNDSPHSSQEGKVDLINCSEMHNGDLAEADQTCRADMGDGQNAHDAGNESLPDVVDTDEVTPTEAEAEWFGLDRVPTRLHMEESSGKQKE